ncbi:MAG: GNAT family N-acetyltransferase [Alphaproteobacteria bacterium]|nr:GNAT family N-acetyltransferase [Alphaproteobacteria bacterium]
MSYTFEHVSPEIAEALCRQIAADLPDYFGLAQANEQYFSGVRTRENFAAKTDGKYVGLLSLDFPCPGSSNVYWMAVLREYQSHGVGGRLLGHACAFAKTHDATTITVETLAPQETDENYLKTYRFYEHSGFKPLFNLKPAGYVWNMVYMVKNLDAIVTRGRETSSTLRPLFQVDIPLIVESFALNNWPKPATIFEAYLKEQESGERLIWLAFYEDQFAGYATLKWESKYQPFKDQGIPEIMDLNVLPPYRGKGIGSDLLERAEQAALKISPVVGLGVGLYQDYGRAQQMYVKHGYIPDGLGLTYNYKPVAPGETVPVDDDLVFWFTKNIG